MQSDYVFLTEKEAMWAEMLIQVLKEHQVAYTAVPVYGAGMVIRAGAQERLKIYVTKEDQARAEDLVEELFSEKAE